MRSSSGDQVYKLIGSEPALSRSKLIVGGLLGIIGTLGYYGAYVYVIWRTLGGAYDIGQFTFLTAAIQQARQGVLVGGCESGLRRHHTGAAATLLQPQPAPDAHSAAAHAQAELALTSIALGVTAFTKLAGLFQTDYKVAGIAQQARVTRLTVYRHFPNVEELYAACKEHWTAQQVRPDPTAWARVAVVPQDYAKWPLTARENITLGQPLTEHGDEAVQLAAHASGADQAVQFLLGLGHRRIGAITGPSRRVATAWSTQSSVRVSVAQLVLLFALERSKGQSRVTGWFSWLHH